MNVAELRGKLLHLSNSIPIVALLLLCGACSRPASPPIPNESPTAGPATFVNRVWSVAQSSAVAPGTLYVFLSDGSLVITSPGNKPMLGSWSRSTTGLVMVEDSLSYQVDILKLTSDEFVIRSHNPGQPVDIAMVLAETKDGH